MLKKETLLVTQARVGSSRLPAKVLEKIDGQTLLDLHLQRAAKSKNIQNFIVATTNEPRAEEILEIAARNGFDSYQGDMNDVLDRFYQAAKKYKPEYVVRLTSDCPLIDPQLIDEVVAFCQNENLDYASNTLVTEFPDGQDVEVFRYQALESAAMKAELLSDREHVTPYIIRNSDFKKGDLFKAGAFRNDHDFGGIRMTVDEEADLLTVRQLVEELGTEASWRTYAEFIPQNTGLFKNQSIERNEGYQKSLLKDSKKSNG